MLHEVGKGAQVRGATSNVNETDLFGISYATEEICMPSGFLCTIRESNGEDEDLLSRMKDTQDGTAMHKYLANIITQCEKYPIISDKVIATWRVRDIYYLLYRSRLLTHGNEVFFDHTFQDGTSVRMKEYLSVYDVNLNIEKPPVFNQAGYDRRKIQPYTIDTDYAQATTSTGKVYRFKLLTGEDEIKSLGLDSMNLSINDKMRLRGFELKDSAGNWRVIERFNVLSARETSEIRATLDRIDPEFMLICELKHPSKPIKEEVSLFAVPGFFFPQ
jgi:hypothetical protein